MVDWTDIEDVTGKRRRVDADRFLRWYHAGHAYVLVFWQRESKQRGTRREIMVDVVQYQWFMAHRSMKSKLKTEL